MAGKARIYRYLDPADALGEVLFGLIMALTLSTSGRLLMISGGFETREFVAAVLGCNIAWGVIDGVLFVLGGAFDRGRRAHFFRVLRQAKDETQAIAAIHDEFSLDDAPLTVGSEDRAALYRTILTLATHATPRAVRLTRDDVVAALIVWLLVSATAIPAVAPFLLIRDQSLALRVSNALSIGLLFVVGFGWARYTEARPWIAGLSIMGLGVALVGVALALGG
jgi:hypothetical protein